LRGGPFHETGGGKAVGLSVGAAREVITPAVGGRLMGYRPDNTSVSVHDDLTVTAIAFEHGGTRAVLLSATVCLVSGELADEIGALIGEAAGLPPAHVIIAPTHTHSGPRTAGSSSLGEIDRAYCDAIFIPKCLQAACRAMADRRPARLGVYAAESSIGSNRRHLSRNGVVGLAQNPWGIYDPNLTVMAFAGEDKVPIANIVHYGAHCTAAGMNREITRDWAGFMTDRMETETGALTAFLNGALGDVCPRISNGMSSAFSPEKPGDISYAAELGAAAALDAVRAFRSIKQYAECDCAAVSDVVTIPYAPLMPLDEAKREFAKFRNAPPQGMALEKYNNLNEIIRYHEEGIAPEPAFVMPQTLLRVGPAVFVPFPFEVFSEISLRLRHYSPYAYTLLLSNTGGWHSYLPSQDQICRGGYEVERFLWRNPRRLPDDTDTRIINENLRIMEGFACLG
jgi:hypothetical protein